MHLQGQEHSYLRLFNSSYSPGIELLPVPGNLKDRNARFGYIIDDAFQRNYYENMGTEGVVEEGDYRNRYTKEAIVRRAIRLAKYTPAIVLKQINPEKWHSLLPLHLTILSIFTGVPPTVKALAKFKEALFLNKDLQWYALGMWIVSVSRIVHLLTSISSVILPGYVHRCSCNLKTYLTVFAYALL